jgi:hypothetical protein
MKLIPPSQSANRLKPARRRMSRAKFSFGLAGVRAAANIPQPAANVEAVEIGRGCLPPGDRD